MNKQKKFDVVGSIIAFEDGQLDDEGALALFAELVRTGMAWSLQGSYGRQAASLIEAGYLSRTGEILKEVA